MNLTEIFVNRLAKDSKVVTIDSLFNEDKVKKTQYFVQLEYTWNRQVIRKGINIFVLLGS